MLEINVDSYQSICKLRQLRIFQRTTDKTLAALEPVVQWVTYQRGQFICRQDEQGDSMFVVVDGRVKVTDGSTASNTRVLRFLDRDEHFGEMSVLTGSRRTANVIAVTNTRVLQINQLAFDLLRENEPDFCAFLSETLANRLACVVRGNDAPLTNRVVGVLFASGCGEQMLRRLQTEMQTMGADVQLLAHKACEHSREGSPPMPHAKMRALEPSNTELLQLCEQHDRVLLAGTYTELPSQRHKLCQCDRIVCFMAPGEEELANRSLQRLLAIAPELAPRIHLVRLLAEGVRFAKPANEDAHSLGRDFKIPWSSGGQSPATKRGFQRIARFLLDQQVGIALGGGGARGLAHLGVLRALEEHDIGIDLVSGTSMGGLVGLTYTAGWSPCEAAAIFREELTPGRLIRMLPRGKSWYMISKFRLGGWESMLRKYVQHARFEQLHLPLCTVSADLIGGCQVVRESGDCVAAILESINLPYISAPIVRNGRVLVDGGILNNIPVDLLRPRGANVEIGVDVSSQLPHSFGRNSRRGCNRVLRRPSMLETAFRLNEIRRFHVSRTSKSDADHMICIDTSKFEFEDFSKAHELAEVGYQAACASIPRIKKLIDQRISQNLKAG